MLESTTGLKIPRNEKREAVVRCPVANLDGKSYQEWVVRLPIKLYDWGLRSLQETCGPAYLGALDSHPLYGCQGQHGVGQVECTPSVWLSGGDRTEEGLECYSERAVRRLSG